MKNRSSFNKKRPQIVGDKRRGGKKTSYNDARTILNFKRANKGNFKKDFVGSTKSSSLPIIKKSISKVPQKHVELSRDGNITVTAIAKNPSKRSGGSVTVPSLKKQIQWTPADVTMDNLECIGIDDLIDMESLPPAVVTTNIQPQNRWTLGQRSLAEEVLSMQNTMVADQVASASASQSGRVIVGNLRSSVSKEDIMELFGDIGLIKSAEMTQPGTAVIEFYSKSDAVQACSTYHNRLLDGQPMTCYVQASTPQRISVCQRLGERVQTTPISHTSSLSSNSRFRLGERIQTTPTSHTSMLSSNSRFRYNPRDVMFTVKLT